MKTDQRWVTFSLCCCFVLAVLVSASVAGEKSTDIRQLYRGDNAFAHIAALTSLGPRPAGGAAELAAAEYIASAMVSYGLDVQIQMFPVNYFEEFSPPQLEQTAPASKIYVAGIDFAAMTYSGSGAVTASVTAVDVMMPPMGGSASGCEAADFAGFPAGNIALIQRGTCIFAVKAQNAEAAGAVGVIIFNEGDTPERTGLLAGTLGVPGVAIPVVGSTFALGQELYLTPGVVVTLVVDAIAEVRTSQNVIGTLEGTQPEQGIVYLGGHYDSVSVSPGANDNASGVGAMLEAARVLTAKGHRTKATLKFIAFGAKEPGLAGSFIYVQENLDEVSTKGLGMINLDAIAVGGTLRIGNIGYPGGGGPELMNYARRKAIAVGMAWEPFTAGANSDHTYFEQVGVPSVFITQRDDPFYHTAEDTLDKIQVDTLEANGELATATMYDWAKNPALRAK